MAKLGKKRTFVLFFGILTVGVLFSLTLTEPHLFVETEDDVRATNRTWLKTDIKGLNYWIGEELPKKWVAGKTLDEVLRMGSPPTYVKGRSTTSLKVPQLRLLPGLGRGGDRYETIRLQIRQRADGGYEVSVADADQAKLDLLIGGPL